MKITDEKLEELLKDEKTRARYKTFEFHEKEQNTKKASPPAFKRLTVITVAALLGAGLIAAMFITAAKINNNTLPILPDVTETVPVPVTDKDTEATNTPDAETKTPDSKAEANVTDIQTEPDDAATGENITDIQTEPVEETKEPVTQPVTEEITTYIDTQTVTEDVTTSDTGTVDYRIYLYANGEGGEEDYSTEIFKGKKFFGTAERTNKTNMDKKTIEMFGNECNMAYTETLDFKIYDEKYDMYIGNSGLFTFSEKTGRLVTYDSLFDELENGFTPPVNKHSNRQEFIDYAKAVLLEYTGVSTDDCNVFIKTTGIVTNYKRTEEESKQDFKNFIDKDPDFSAEYEIVFRKKFCNIYRVDDITVTVRNDGKILQIKSRTCDEKYEPFFNVDINTEHLIDQMKDLSYDPRYISYNILLRAIPDGKELWVLADVEYEYEDSGNIINSGRQYITKVIGTNDE